MAEAAEIVHKLCEKVLLLCMSPSRSSYHQWLVYNRHCWVSGEVSDRFAPSCCRALCLHGVGAYLVNPSMLYCCLHNYPLFTGAKATPGVARTSENNVWLKSDLVSLFLTNQISTLSTFLTYWEGECALQVASWGMRDCLLSWNVVVTMLVHDSTKAEKARRSIIYLQIERHSRCFRPVFWTRNRQRTDEWLISNADIHTGYLTIQQNNAVNAVQV